MKKMFVIGLILVSLYAQEAQCSKEAQPSRELNAWKSLSYVSAATTAEALPHASIEVGKASYVGLHSTPKVSYVARPTNEGGAVSYGGMFNIEIKQNGLYRVALGNASWLDLIKDGKATQSFAHQEGPKNSGIRKMVDYPLEAGVYTLQLSAGGDSTTAVLITKIN
jgi:hypothetical protein